MLVKVATARHDVITENFAVRYVENMNRAKLLTSEVDGCNNAKKITYMLYLDAKEYFKRQFLQQFIMSSALLHSWHLWMKCVADDWYQSFHTGWCDSATAD